MPNWEEQVEAHLNDYGDLVESLHMNEPQEEVLVKSIWSRRMPQLPTEMLMLLSSPAWG